MTLPWAEVLLVFLACHVVGDFLLQTDHQAVNKHAGLGEGQLSSRALLSHVGIYTLSFSPAVIWLAAQGVAPGLLAALGALLFLTHLLIDDGRLLERYVRLVKGESALGSKTVLLLVDQSMHFLTLFGLALLVVV